LDTAEFLLWIDSCQLIIFVRLSWWLSYSSLWGAFRDFNHMYEQVALLQLLSTPSRGISFGSCKIYYS
jgi:hypothetical protein